MLTPSLRSGPSGFVMPVIRWDGTRWLTLADPLSVGRILLVAATAGNTVVFAGGILNFDFVECALHCVVCWCLIVYLCGCVNECIRVCGSLFVSVSEPFVLVASLFAVAARRLPSRCTTQLRGDEMRCSASRSPAMVWEPPSSATQSTLSAECASSSRHSLALLVLLISPARVA